MRQWGNCIWLSPTLAIEAHNMSYDTMCSVLEYLCRFLQQYSKRNFEGFVANQENDRLLIRLTAHADDEISERCRRFLQRSPGDIALNHNRFVEEQGAF